MEAVHSDTFISAEDYLEGERHCDIRHEYIDGLVYAMAGASARHNIICQNLLIALREHFRGRPCQVYMEGVKLQVRTATSEIYYYPDLMVTCDPRDTDEYLKKYPNLLIEVLSPDTARVDRHEKFQSYTNLETLEEYVLVAQESKEVTVFRRNNQWRPEIIGDTGQKLHLASLNFSMELSAIYEGV